MTQTGEVPNSKPAITVWMTTGQLIKLLSFSLVFVLIGYGLYRLGIDIEKKLLNIFALLFIIAGLLTIQRLFIMKKQPLVICYEHGFKTPDYDLILWEDIIGIYFEEKIINHVEVITIILGIKHGKTINSHFNFLMILWRFILGARYDRIIINLSGVSIPPYIVHDTMRQLWEKRTGNSYEWNPNYSEEYNSAFRNIIGGKSTSKTLTDFKIIKEENKRKSRKDLWGAILTGLFIAWFSWYLRN